MAPNANQVYTQGLNKTLMGARISAVEIIKEAVRLGVPDSANLKVLLAALRSEAIPRSMRQQMWEEIGTAARFALFRAYLGRPHARPIPSYRQGDRQSGGELRRALSNPQMIRATPTGLFLINRDILDKEARHWRRLNFGAGGGGREGDLTPPGRFPVSGMGMLIGLEPDPRPAFSIPPGFWIGRDGQFMQPSDDRTGQDQFYLRSSSAALAQSGSGGFKTKRMTRGIAANNFLDAPMEVVAAQIKPGLDRLWESARAKKGRDEIIRRKTGRARIPRAL